MSALYILNTQIYSLQNSISYLNSQLDQRKEELSRLKKALSNLSSCKDDFSNNKKLCLLPELSSNTWDGKLAFDFDTYKESELQASYLSISSDQLSDAITRLEEEIEAINQTIQDLEGDISSQNTRLHNLNEERRRELMELNE